MTSIKRNALTDEKKFQLLVYVQENRQRFDDYKYSFVDAAALCSKELGFTVNDANLKNLCKAAKIKWTSPSPKVQKQDLEERVDYLMKVVDFLQKEYGVKYEGELGESQCTS